uniref:Uncharacterized protein n=1 Tax=Anguilla anguilla TaxID=7936 RepID=A0A0E9XU12_ANGAN
MPTPYKRTQPRKSHECTRASCTLRCKSTTHH